MSSTFARSGLRSAAVVAVVSAWACASARPPAPGEARGGVPDLAGQPVMVLPVQINQGVAGDPDAELAFALKSHAPNVGWILPDSIRSALQASPALQAPLTGLPVEVFLRTEVQRLGDPVYGVLRRLGALTGADLAVLPVAALAVPPSAQEAGEVQISAALMDVRTGRVLWYGVEAGAGGGADPGALAGAMDSLGRWFAPRRAGATP